MARRKIRSGDPNQLALHLGDPYSPYNRGIPTSQAAAGNPKRKAKQEATVLMAIHAAGPEGLTDDEGEQRVGISHQAYSARRRGLVLKGYVVSTEQRRETRQGRTAIVWVSAKVVENSE